MWSLWHKDIINEGWNIHIVQQSRNMMKKHGAKSAGMKLVIKLFLACLFLKQWSVFQINFGSKYVHCIFSTDVKGNASFQVSWNLVKFLESAEPTSGTRNSDPKQAYLCETFYLLTSYGVFATQVFHYT